MEIEGYPNYLIYDDGRVYSKKSKKFLKQDLRKGYYDVHLYRDKKQYHMPIHRLVAKHYIPNPCNHPTVDHIDRNKTNNHVSNLRWACLSMQGVNQKDKITNTGRKNIYILTGKNKQSYQILIRRNKNCYSKYFKIETPIQTVIDFRDMMLSMFLF